MLKLKEELIS